jgi:predicted ATPase
MISDSNGKAGGSASLDVAPAQLGVFARTGEYWTVAYGGATFSLPHLKGLSYIQRLIRYPGQEIHALDLSSEPNQSGGFESRHASSLSGEPSISIGGLGDAGKMLDEQAKRDYKQRLLELREHAEDFSARGDRERASEAESEIEFLQRELARAVGLGGRYRRSGSAAERARLNVTRAIKVALQKIFDHQPALSRLLDRSIKRGSFCSYAPNWHVPISWQFSIAGHAARDLIPSIADDARSTGFIKRETGLLQSFTRGTALVGREAELAILRRCLEESSRGEGRVVLISGAPGVGKTRIAAEIAVEASDSGAQIFVGSCYDREDSVPFLPFVEILEAALAREGCSESFRENLGQDASEIARLLPQLRQMFTDILPPQELTPQQSRRALFNALAGFLARMAHDRPVLLFLDDLHWADEGTLSLLNHLAGFVPKIPILLFAAYRDIELDPAGSLARALDELIRLQFAEHIHLGGLEPEATTAMLRALSGRDVHERLANLIYSYTEGNPFFIKELFLHLVEQGKVLNSAGEFRLDFKPEEIDVSPTLRLVIGRRLARLSQEAQKILTIAGVIGRSFTFRLLEASTSFEPERLLKLLEEAERVSLINSSLEYPEAKFSFSHELIRHAVVSRVSAPRRQRLHLAVSNAIERLYPTSLHDHAEDLAHHLAQAGTIASADKTAKYVAIAAERADAKSAFKEAEEGYRHALAMLATLPETPDRIDQAFNLQVKIWYLAGFARGPATVENVRETERLRELGEKTSDPDRLLLMLLATFVSTFNRGEMAAARQIGAQIQQIAERSRNSLGLSLSYTTQGTCCMFRGELAQAMHHFDQEMGSYSETDSPWSFMDQHLQVLIAVGWITWHTGNGDQGRSKIREAISLSEHSKHSAIVADALKYASLMYMDLREVGDTQETAERLFTYAAESHLTNHQSTASVCRGWAMAERGRTEEGIALMRKGIDFATEHERLGLLRALSEAQERAGQLQEAFATNEQALHTVGEQQIYLPGLLWRRGELHLRQGEESKADTDFREAIAIARRIGSKAYELRATTSLARLLRDTNRHAEARAMLAEIYNWFTEGFDTSDLKDAKVLLDELAKPAPDFRI